MNIISVDGKTIPEEIQMTIPVKKVNYLNNKDMLKEIHRSKSSFCEYIDRTKYMDYDVIVENVDAIFSLDTQEKGKLARAARFTIAAYETAVTTTVIVNKSDKPKMA